MYRYMARRWKPMRICEKCGYRPMQTVPRQADVIYVCSNPKCSHVRVEKKEVRLKEESKK
ncbi:hypothetical protein COC63_06170 [Bacillus cereus]|nr:hypothetical protein COC63_06170 [Bacillus cereus]